MGSSFPKQIKELFIERKTSFLNNIRAINADFAMASLSVRQYQYKTGGPYCFRISGQIYRNFNTAALPENSEQPTGG